MQHYGNYMIVVGNNVVSQVILLQRPVSNAGAEIVGSKIMVSTVSAPARFRFLFL